MPYTLTDMDFGTATTHESFGSAQNVGQLCSVVSGRYRVTDESGRVLGTWSEGKWTPFNGVQCECHDIADHTATTDAKRYRRCTERAEYLGKMLSLNNRVTHQALKVCEGHKERFNPGVHEDRPTGTKWRETLTKLKTD